MRFQVPQFIEIEDKIVGPLTLRQFIYLAGGAGMAFVAWRFLPIYISIFVIAIIVLLSVALSFYKMNNRPFIDILESAFSFYTGEKLYIWKKRDKEIKHTDQIQKAPEQMAVPSLSESKLKDLSWSLDVNEHIGGEKGK